MDIGKPLREFVVKPSTLPIPTPVPLPVPSAPVEPVKPLVPV